MSAKINRAKLLPLVLGLILTFLLVATASAAVWTDQEDYEPGSDSTTGTSEESVILNVQGPNGYTAT